MKTVFRSILVVVALAFLIVPTATVQAQFNYTVTNGTVTITKYTGAGGAVTIPDTINGLPVTRIGQEAFNSCTNLIKVTIPDSVTSIEDGSKDLFVLWGAFSFCRNLTSVTIGTRVTNIGVAAFFLCTSVTTITIPNSVSTIGADAFSNCTGLTNVTIGNGVTSIGDSTFVDCTSLNTITVEANNPTYSSVAGVLFNKDQTTLIKYPIGKAESSFTVPNSVTTIGGDAFLNCTGLANITIGTSITNIGDGAFTGCTSLMSVTIPNSVTRIGNEAFLSTGLTRITIPSSVTEIGDAAFSGCWSLTSITVPASINKIGWFTFGYCTSLTEVYFHGNAPSLGGSVFYDANNATVYYLAGTTGWGTTFGGRPTAPWVLPNPVILTTAPDFGVQTNQFGFRISWATNGTVIVEASTTLANAVWSPVSTNALVNGWFDFRDAEGTNHAIRFYRVRAL